MRPLQEVTMICVFGVIVISLMMNLFYTLGTSSIRTVETFAELEARLKDFKAFNTDFENMLSDHGQTAARFKDSQPDLHSIEAQLLASYVKLIESGLQSTGIAATEQGLRNAVLGVESALADLEESAQIHVPSSPVTSTPKPIATEAESLQQDTVSEEDELEFGVIGVLEYILEETRTMHEDIVARVDRLAEKVESRSGKSTAIAPLTWSISVAGDDGIYKCDTPIPSHLSDYIAAALRFNADAFCALALNATVERSEWKADTIVQPTATPQAPMVDDDDKAAAEASSRRIAMNQPADRVSEMEDMPQKPVMDALRIDVLFRYLQDYLRGLDDDATPLWMSGWLGWFYLSGNIHWLMLQFSREQGIEGLSAPQCAIDEECFSRLYSELDSQLDSLVLPEMTRLLDVLEASGDPWAAVEHMDASTFRAAQLSLETLKSFKSQLEEVERLREQTEEQTEDQRAWHHFELSLLVGDPKPLAEDEMSETERTPEPECKYEPLIDASTPQNPSNPTSRPTGTAASRTASAPPSPIPSLDPASIPKIRHTNLENNTLRPHWDRLMKKINAFGDIYEMELHTT
ncbi:hypothetical protein LTR36_010046 [Oleoguttula mirabilis]|uniref:Uncharacterized protein n=1 Tax=Oleoguttula mirabilis TaxID=1507867 RepID=A0AAV9JSY7_9PEZI|nr:hypothetical protein LTR36_010046 [Oleoguttula mirabilis]